MALGDFTPTPGAPVYGEWIRGFLDTGQPLPRNMQAWMVRSAGMAAAPKLALDFTTSEILDPRISASGGANGTRTNSSGFIVPAVTPRYDYHPITFEPLGVLAEGPVTNLQIQSNNWNVAQWQRTDVVITNAATISPEGIATGSLVTEGSAGTALIQNGAGAGLSITIGGTYIISRYYKYGNCRWVLLSGMNGTNVAGGNAWFDLLNGVMGATQTIGVASGVFARMTPVGNGWYRCSLTLALNASYNAIVTRSSSAAGDFSLVRVPNSTYYMFGAQFETGSVPTTYIATTTATVARTADSLVMTGANFSSWYNASEGSFAYEGDSPGIGTSGAANFFYADNGSGVEVMLARYSAGGVLDNRLTSGAVVQFSLQFTGNIPDRSVDKGAFGYKLNDNAASVNGATVQMSAAIITSPLTQIGVGCSTTGTQNLNGHMRRLSYWASRLPNAILQLLAS